MEKIYSLREWAKETNTSYWFWYKLLKEGRLPCIKTEGKNFVRRSAVESWIAQEEAASVSKNEPPKEYGTLRRID